MTMQKSSKPKSTVQWCSIPLNRTLGRTAMPQPQSDTWVQLLEPESFSPLCHDEALLLCQISNWEWAAWIPDHGEAVINIEQFCCPTR